MVRFSILVLLLVVGCGSEQTQATGGASSEMAPVQYTLDGTEHSIEVVDAVYVEGNQPSVAMSGSHTLSDGLGITLSIKIFQFDGVGSYPVEVVNGGLVASLTTVRTGGEVFMVTAQADPGAGAVIDVTEYDADSALISGRFSGTVSDGTSSWTITDGTFQGLSLRTM